MLDLIFNIYAVLTQLFGWVVNTFKKVKYSFYIQPSMVIIPSGWGVVKTLKIVNNNNFPIYDIQIKICLFKGQYDIADIKIKRMQETLLYQRLSTSKNTSVVGLDEMILSGVDKNNEKWQRIFVNNIDPNSIVNYKLEFLKGSNLKDGSIVKIKVTNFSKEQGNILYRDSSVFFPFKIKD